MSFVHKIKSLIVMLLSFVTFASYAAELFVVEGREFYNPKTGQSIDASIELARNKALEDLQRIAPVSAFKQVSEWRVTSTLLPPNPVTHISSTSILVSASFVRKNEFLHDWFMTIKKVRGTIAGQRDCGQYSELGIAGLKLATEDANFYCNKGAKILPESVSYTADEGTIFYCHVSARFMCKK